MMSRDAKWLKSHRLFFLSSCPFAPGVIIIKRLSAAKIFFFRSDCGEISLPFLDPSRDLGARGMGDPPPPPSPIPPWSRLHPEKRKKIFLLFSYLGILCTQTKLTVSRRQGEEEELEEGGEHLEKKRKMGLEAHFPYKGLYWREALWQPIHPPPLTKKALNLGQPTNQETRREDNLCLPPLLLPCQRRRVPRGAHSCVSELWAHQRPIFTVGPRGLAFGRTVPWGDPKYNETYSVFRFIPQPPPGAKLFNQILWGQCRRVVNSILLANISPRTKDIGVMFFEASKFFLGSSKNWARS